MPGTPRERFHTARERFTSAASLDRQFSGPYVREYSQSPSLLAESPRNTDSPAGAALPSSAFSSPIPQRRMRWNISWKVLLMGFIVAYQVVALLTIHPTDTIATRDSWFRFGFGHSRGRSNQGEDVLSPPIEPEPHVDVRPINRGKRQQEASADRHESRQDAESGAGVDPSAGQHRTAPPLAGTDPHVVVAGAKLGGAGGGSDSGDVHAGAKEGRWKGAAHGAAGSGEMCETCGKKGRGQNVTAMSEAELQALRMHLHGCTPLATFFGFMGGAVALTCSACGAGYGIAKSGLAIAQLGMMNKKEVLRGMLPVIMSELLSIYGLIMGVSITLAVGADKDTYPLGAAWLHLGSGLAVGLSCMAAGTALGILGTESNLTLIRNKDFFSTSVLLLIFCEALALYGLIIALLMSGTASTYARSRPCYGQ